MAANPEDYGRYENKMFEIIVNVNGPPNTEDGLYSGTKRGKPAEYGIDQLRGYKNNPSWMFTPSSSTGMGDGAGTMGGRRRGTKKARKGNKMLSSWVAFVKKVQHEEKISYSDAMKRASARKKEWKRGQMGGAESMSDDSTGSGSGSDSGSGSGSGSGTGYTVPDDDMDGGRRRRGTKRRGSRKRRGTRKRR